MTTTVPQPKTCATCAHCDTSEATPATSTWMREKPAMAGICTARWNYFAHRFVPVWLTGCPDYEAVPA